jgi:hypothetical protein
MQHHPQLSRGARTNPGPYMSHVQHKNQQVFPSQAPGYITIKDPYHDPAKRMGKPAARFTGKQFLTNPPKDVSDGNGYFNKMRYANEKYVEVVPYTVQQPADKRKLGFGSHDAAKRGEFSTTIRTEQYRQQLKMELLQAQKLSKESAVSGDDLHQAATGNQEVTFPSGLKPCRHLFDIGRQNITEFDPKSKSDTFYNALMCKSRKRPDRRDGMAMVSSNAIGNGIRELDHATVKPKHGHVRATKAFYDRSHIGQSPIS